MAPTAKDQTLGGVRSAVEKENEGGRNKKLKRRISCRSAVGGIEERCWKSPSKFPTGISGHRRAAEIRAGAKTSGCVMDLVAWRARLARRQVDGNRSWNE